MECVLFIVLGAIVGLAGVALNALVLWIAAKLTKNDTFYKTMFAISLICSLIGWIPVLGGLLSAILLFVLLSKWACMDFWPDGVLTVVVSWLVMYAMAFLLGSIFFAVEAAI